ncbi:WYL domain containing protein [uncultured Caudovirales phage]|uniref:WYL domain containing protein n=1 Tax=uncultured Caudovirales phage TaxID=2100421 RepID=A0A6J7WUQ4_9CAUD|nr:WYL domain containing protein [uncultured Caudovirales phage]
MKEIETGWYNNATPEEQGLFRDWLLGVLNDVNVFVKFNKKDGTEREMLCTLSDEAPAYEKKTERKANPDTCFVFDVEKKEWRSFRYDSVTRVSFEYGL